MKRGSPNGRTYEFTLQLKGPDVTAEEVFDVLSEATEDSALFSKSGGLQFADFDLRAHSFPEAVSRAIRMVDGALPGLRVVKILPEDLVTRGEIAARTGRSRQNITQLIKGQRGPGGFPQPVAHVRSESPLWSWAEVSAWFHDWDEDFSEEPLIAEFVGIVNGLLEAREHTLGLREKLARRDPTISLDSRR